MVFYWVASFVQNREPTDVAAGCAVFALLAGATAFPLRWKVRLGEEGVSRRMLFRWDLWRWADLGSGRIRKMHPYTLYDHERPWWRRKLRLEYMASGDLQEVIAVVNTHYRLPPPPTIPNSLAIKFGFRRSATFDRNGIHLVTGRTLHEYDWHDVRDIHIMRMDPLRRDFTSLVIALPDQEIELKLVTHQGGTSPTWRGATSEEVNEFLYQTLTNDRIHVSIAGEPLTKREHIERKLRKVQETNRQLVLAGGVFTAFLIGFSLWMLIADGIVKALLMATIFLIPVGSIYVFMYRSFAKEIGTLRSMLESVSNDNESPPRHPST